MLNFDVRKTIKLLMGLFCVGLSASSCLAEEHVCPDYPEMDQALIEGKERLKALPSIDALPAGYPLQDSVRRLTYTLSDSDAEPLVDGIDIKNEQDLYRAFFASQRLFQSNHLDLCLLVWDKIYHYCAKEFGEANEKTVVCNLYRARLHVLLGGRELKSPLKEELAKSGSFTFRTVAESYHDANFCVGDKQKLISHWQLARSLYRGAFDSFQKSSDAGIKEYLRLQLACFSELSDEFDQAFDLAFAAYEAEQQTERSKISLSTGSSKQTSAALLVDPGEKGIQALMLNLFQVYFGATAGAKPVTVLVDYVIAHKDWAKIEMVTNEILKNRNPGTRYLDRQEFAKIFCAYRSSHRSADVFSLAEKLTTENDYDALSDSFSVLIACASEQEKPKILAMMAKLPATVRDARALEDNGWVAEAERVYIKLNEDNPNSNHYEFDLAEFYQRRNRWNEAALVYDALIKNIQHRCDEDDSKGLEVCKSLLLAVSRSMSPSPETNFALTKEMRTLQSALDSCDRRRQALECLSLSEELYETGSNLEKKGDQATAKKMYLSSLEIKEKNLPAIDSSKVGVLTDLARIEASEGDVKAAQLKFERAVSICRKSPNVSPETFRYALETYGAFLSGTKQTKRSDEIYKWARTFDSQEKSEKPKK